MCTLVILRRPEHRWPVVIGANRDEMIDRPWEPPGRHWPDRPEVVAGLDRLAGGAGARGTELGGAPADRRPVRVGAASWFSRRSTMPMRSPPPRPCRISIPPPIAPSI